MPTIGFTIKRSSDCEMAIEIEEVTRMIDYLQDKNYDKFLRGYWAIIRSNKEDFSLEDESAQQLRDMQEAEEFPLPFGGEGGEKVLDLIHKYYETCAELWELIIEEKIDTDGIDEYEHHNTGNRDITIFEVQRE